MEHFFDASAIIQILLGDKKYERFAASQIVTNALHLAEVYYFFLRTKGKREADGQLRQLRAALLSITENIALDAAAFRFEHRKANMSYADCIGYVTALKHRLQFVTCDSPFKGMPGVEFV
jgi:predicted nucleic acid-binding protein